jgi:hypothetical protein
LGIGIILDNAAVKNGFNNIRPVEPFFQCVNHSMALDEITAISNALLNRCEDKGRHSTLSLAPSLAAYESVEL